MFSKFLLKRYESLFPDEIPYLDKSIPTSIRVNTLRCDRDDLVDKLEKKKSYSRENTLDNQWIYS